jgi:hypothetical protein
MTDPRHRCAFSPPTCGDRADITFTKLSSEYLIVSTKIAKENANKTKQYRVTVT